MMVEDLEKSDSHHNTRNLALGVGVGKYCTLHLSNYRICIQSSLWAVIVFVFTKAWVFGLPGFWHLRIEKQPFSWSPAKKG